MLTDLKVRQAKPRDSDYKLGDSGGLYLQVTKAGSKSWRFKYHYAGKEKRLTFGRYPEVSLAEARDRRDEARRVLRDMRDPAVEAMKRRLAATAAAEATFEKIAREWHEMQTPRWVSVHAADVLRSLENEVFPHLGSVPLKEIEGSSSSGASPHASKRPRETTSPSSPSPQPSSGYAKCPHNLGLEPRTR